MSGPSPTTPAAPIEILRKLADVSDEKLLEVVKYLSSVPATAEILALLDQLRPKLRRLRPPRPVSLKRLWCRPFEDLLVSVAAEPESGRIPRTAIEPCWQALEQRGGGWLRTLQADLAKLQPNEPLRILEVADQLWQRSGEIFDQLPADAATIPHLTTIRDMLVAGSAIDTFKRALPGKPIERLGEPEVIQIDAGLRGLTQRGIRSSGFLLAVAARMRNPAALLILQKHGDVPFPMSLRRQLAAMAIAVIDDQARNLERMTADATASPRDIAREAEQLMKSIIADHDDLDEATRRQLDQRTAIFTGTVRDAIDGRVIKTAAATIEVALPGSGQTTQMLIAAEDHAQTFGRSRGVAVWAGLERETAEAAKKISGRFEEKLGELLNQVDNSGEVTAVERDVYRSIRIIELIDGPQRAQQVLAQALKRLRAARQRS